CQRVKAIPAQPADEKVVGTADEREGLRVGHRSERHHRHAPRQAQVAHRDAALFSFSFVCVFSLWPLLPAIYRRAGGGKTAEAKDEEWIRRPVSHRGRRTT